jgi:gliding motility-associated-like protein
MKKIILLLAFVFTCLMVNAQITSYPYAEDFESGDGGWTVDNTIAGSWALGVPAATVINSADSGANAWVTNLVGNYNANEGGIVTSPVFDLSSLSAPSIQMSIWWNSEFSWDGMVLQSSIDDGATWQNVGAFGDPNNWYTDNSINGNPGGQQEGWSGSGAGSGSQGWVVARHALNGLAGEANVILRCAFGSDGSVQLEGIGFDTISIFEVSCPEPSAISVTGVTENAAELSWIAGGAEMDWEVAVQPIGSGEPAGSGTATNNNPYPISMLNPSTAYEVYLRSDCGAGEFSSWVGPVIFTTLNVPPPAPVGVSCATGASSFIFTENFDQNPPSGWTGTGFDGSNGNWDIAAAGANSGGTGPEITFDGGTGTHLEYEASGDATDIASAVSPAIDLSAALDGAELSFFFHAFGADMGTLNVGIANDPAGPFTNVFSWVGDLQITDVEAWVPVGVNLDAYLGQLIYLEFSYGGAGTGFEGDMSIDFIRVESCGDFCIPPTSITVDNITAFEADINWIAGGAEMDWEVAVQPVGTGLPTAPGIATQDNPYTAMTLTPVTEYEVWVRSNCLTSGFSTWAGPVNFQTGCDIFVPDYLESFGTIIPNCWDEADDGDLTTGPTGLGGSNWTQDGFLNVGFDGAYKINLWQSFKSDWLLSPQFDLTGGPFQVDFDFGIMQFGSSANAGTLGSDDTVELVISTDNGATWINLLTFDNTSVVPPTGTQVVFDLTAYAGQIVQFGILGSEGTVDDPEDNDIFVDNFRVRGIPSCQEPTGLTIANVTGTTVDVSWTAGGAEMSWEYIVIPAGTGPPTGPGTVTTTNTVTITDLLFETAYEVWVRADCGAEGLSSWVGPGEFNTTIQSNFDVDCTAGPLAGFLCYGNNDSLIITYTSSDGSPLNLSFLAGEVEGAPFDFLVVFDTDGTELYNDEGDNGDISGLTFQSTGDTISFQVASDGSVSCDSGSFCCSDGIDFTVACATCINPAATYQIIDDCDSGDQFLVDVNVTNLGDATSLTISNNVDAITVPATAIGVYQVGPFPFATDVVITLSNDQDVNCVINSSTIRLEACPPDNDNPCNATVAGVNADDSCTIITSGTLLEATDSGIPAGTCGGDPDDDVWFEFTALAEFQIIQLTNVAGGGFFQNLDHAVYEGACDAPVELYCSDADASLTTSLTVGNTYYVRVFSAGDVPVDYTFDLCIRPGSGNVSVDQTTYTIEELVTDILINSPCAQITNITSSTGSDFGDVNGIGYFSSDEGSFPFAEGILLTSGDASLAGGPNFNAMSDGGFAWAGDLELDAAVGINSNNASIIEFDFVPLTDEISFDFLMASEEYNGSTGGTFECTFSDAFAFLLTDEFGVTTNLAVLPGTTTPILVTNIHPANPGCPAINEEFFGGYTPANLPPISFDGRTTVFTASAPVNIGSSYSIKLVIADATDTALDSGVFLKAGSFDIGEVELGVDITVDAGTAVCIGEEIILETQAPSVAHVWFKDGFQIAGETTNTLVVTEDGVYTTQIIFSPSCIIEDQIIIEFLQLPIANMPVDIVECSTTGFAIFDLNINNDEVLAGQSPIDFTLTYHETEDDANNDANPLGSPYPNVADPQIIYARVENNVTGCFNTTTFSLLTSQPSFVAASVELIGCDNDNDGVSEFDLDAHDVLVLDGLDASQFIVTYYTTQADADLGLNPLTSLYESSGETIYVRVESIDYIDCFVTNSFNLVLGTKPETTFTEDFDYEVCPDAVVPIIIEATPVNYDVSQVSISWFYAFDASATQELVAGENSLTLPVLVGGIYTIEISFNDTGCTSSQSQEVIQLESCFIPQGISPNGDGMNDSFDLSNFRVTRLEIFNRYGTSVYQKNSYVDEWIGLSDNGDELPVGTYFYSIDFEDKESETGWVYIQREQ